MKKFLFILTLFLLSTGMSWAQNVAKIGTIEYATLDAAIAAAQTGETIEIIASACTIANTSVIPSGVTITGQGKTSTTMTVTTSNGDGIKITNPNVTIKDMTIDGHNLQNSNYYSIINVKADGCLIDNVVTVDGPVATWGSAILVTDLSSSATVTVSNSDITIASRGLLRENCGANIVITNCNIDATYPFNIDGGSGGTVTVTGGALHGNTSYGGVDQVTFENVTFSMGTFGGHDQIYPYSNTVFINCNMDSQLRLVPKAQNLDLSLEDCTKDGVLITSENVMEMFPEPSGSGVYSLYTVNTTTVNEVVLVSNQSQLDGAVADAVANSKTSVLVRLIANFDYDGNICGPASGTLNVAGDSKIVSLSNFGPTDMTVTTANGANTYTYTCANSCNITLNNPVLALGENCSITTPAQTSVFVAASGYDVVETDNGNGSYTYTTVAVATDAVAKIGNNTYTSLADAHTAANDGETIVLLRDITLTETQYISKSITLDLAYKTISGGFENLLRTNADGLTVTIQNGIITNTSRRCVSNPANSEVNINNCTITAEDYAVQNNGTGTLNIENSTLKATKSNQSYTVVCQSGTVNLTDCQITANRYCIRNTNGTVNVTGGSMNTTNTASGVNVYQTGTGGVINIQDVDAITAKSKVALCATAGTINAENVTLISATENTLDAKTAGTINIINCNVTAKNSAILNEGGNSTITINDGTVTVAPESAGTNYGINCAGGITNVLGATTITDNALTTAAVYCETGTFNMSAGTISASNSCITTTDMSYVHLTGGTYSENVTGEMCDPGYAAFANGTAPETWTVVPAYNIYYDANNSTTEKDTAYVPQAEPTHTVQANAFTNTLSFRAWNTKADGTGTEFVPGATITVDSDTTLYAQWGKVFNVDNATFYDNLQTAINAATAGDSLVVLTDLNLTATIAINKSLKINGGKHVIKTTSNRGLWFDAGSVTLNLKNFYLDGTNMIESYGIRGIQVDQNDVTLNMDSCRVYNVDEYAFWAFRDKMNLNVTVTNSYIEGMVVLKCYASNSTFSFVNDTLYGLNPCATDMNYATIFIEGNNEPTLGNDNSFSFEKCVIISEAWADCDPLWLGIAFSASGNNVTVDADTKIIDNEDEQNDLTAEMNFWLGGGKNYVTMPLSSVQIDSVEANFYTVTASGSNSVISAPVLWKGTKVTLVQPSFDEMFIDFHIPFDFNLLSTGDILTLDDDITLKDTVHPGGVKFELNLATYTITPGVNCIMLSEADTVITDDEVDIFCSEEGMVNHIDNGDGTFTYAITPYVALNMNTGTGYTNLQSAVDAVNAGDTIRILRNINLTSMVNVNESVVNNFTIDLNGDTISFSGSGSNDAAIRILNGAELTIKDNGTNGAIINPGKGSAVLGGYGTLVLNSGILEGKGSSTNALYLFYLGTSPSTQLGSAIINGGTLKSTSGMAIRHRGDMLTINDGTFISGNNNVIQNQSNAEINGGTFTPGATYRYAIYNMGTMTINDATTNGTGGSLSNSGKMTVNDGVFHSIGGNAAYNSGADTLTINSGDFYVSATNGFRNTNNAGTFLFNGGTVTDHGVTQSVIYNTGKFVMTGVEISASAADYTVWIDANGIFEAHNGKIENTNADQSALIYCDDGDAQITIDGTQLIGTANNTYGIWEVGPNVNITMTSGSINTTKYCIVNNGTNTTTTSKWVISGGTLTSETTAIYHAAPDSVIIGIDCDNGPTITGVNAAIEHRAGHLVIKGGTLTATGTPYSCTANASGTTTVGAAVAVAQHTTNVETTMDISCGTFEGESSISIANPQGNTGDNVDASITGGSFTGEVVTSDTRIDDYITGGTFDDATVIGELTNRIEPGYYPFDNGDGTTTVGRYSVVYHDNTSDDLKYGVMLTHDFPETITITMPSTFAPVADRVVAWNTKSDGTGDWYTEGETVEIDSYLDLYAHWVAVYNATQDIYYTTLQGAIDAATANDSLVVLTDLTINASVIVNKSIIINGQKHIIDATNAIIGTTKMALAIDEINLDVKIRNLNIDGGNTCQKGVQVSGSGWADNCTVMMDSCRIYNFTHYAITAWGNSNGTRFNVSNSYIQGWTALSCYGGNSTFNFYNDTLHGINRQSGGNNDLNVITLNGQSTSTQYGIQQANKVDIQKCVIIAEELSTSKEFWLGLSYGAKNDTVTVDCETRIVDGTGSEAQNVAGKIYMYEEWEYDEVITGNVITVALTSEQKEALSAIYTLNDVTGDCDRTRISLATKYTKNNGASTMYVDFNYPFNNGLAANDKIELLEDVTMNQNDTANINGNFKLNFKEGSVTHSITQNGYHIILAESATCTTDQQALSLFSSPSGYVTETNNGDGTYTYGMANVYNVNKSKGYSTLHDAVAEAAAGDSILVLTDLSATTVVEVGKSLKINGLKHTITSTATRGIRITASNLDVSIRNLNIDCPSNIPQSDYRGISVDGDMSNINLLIDSCRITGARYGINMSQGSTNINATVTNSYIKAQASLNCYSNQSTFTFNNDTIYGINKWSGSGEDFGTIVIDGYNNSSYLYGKNNNINITQSVIIAEKQGTALQHVFRLQKRASSNNIVVDCQTKILNGAGAGAQDVREELFIGDQNCPYNSIILPLTDEQKAIIASDAAGRRFGLTDTGDDVCGTMTMTKVSRQARNGRCSQDIGFHLYFDTEHYANHVIAGGSAKLTLIEDVVLQKDETVDVNGRFLLFFKDWYNLNITHNIINNGHHIILAEGTSCGTDVEVPDSIFAVPAGFDGKIVHKSVSGQVHKFEYYAAPYVAINVNRDIKYVSLQTAADSVNTGDTVRLLRNITYTTTSDRVIITDKKLTLDLYGDTITTNFSGTSAGQYAAIQLKSGYLEIKDTKGEGVIRATNRGSAVLVGTSTSAGGNASFTLNSGKLEGTATSNTWGLYVVLNDADSVVINGGEVSATGNGPALYNKQGKVVVNGGRIQGNGRAVYNYYAYNNTYFPTTILNGGEIYGGNSSYSCIDNDGGTFIINDGTITMAGTTGISSKTNYYGGTGELYINGGVISDEGLTTNTINTIAGSKGKITITGGTFNLSNDDATVININGQDTVTVTSGTFAATGANDIIFKGAGNGAVFTISDATLNAAAMFNLGSGDSCVVSGGKFTATDDMFTNAGKLTLNGGVFTQSSDNAITNTGTFTVNDGWYSESLTRLTRGTPRWLNGDDISYYGTPELHLIKVADDAVAAAGLTGNYWQLGNTITYDANGGTGSESQDKPMNETVNLSDGTGFSYEGHTLYRWNTADDGNGDNYALGAEYSNNVDLKLYAVWRLNLDMEMDSTDVVCYGENNGTDTVKIIGGEAPFQLVLSGTVLAENDTVKNLMDRTYIYKNLKPGKYTVQLTDVLTKDTIKGTFTIAQPDTLIVESMTVPEKPCPLMGTGAYDVSVTTTGGNGGNHFSWTGAVDIDAAATTVVPGADDRDSTYTVKVTVTDKKGCTAEGTATFSVSPVIADDGTVHSNSKLTIDTIKQGIMSGCDTVLRNFGTPVFTSTHPEINEGILDTIYNDIPTSYPDSVFSLGENVVIWTAVDTCGHMITGKQIIIIYHYPCPDVEMDGYTYHSVRLACDCWTDENLKTTKYSDGRAVNNLMKYESPTHPDAEANFAIYGYLYDWTAALDAESGVTPDADGNVQGICPTGWHLPSDIEFMRVAGNGGEYDMFELRYHGYWLDGGGNNSTDFSLLPGGCYNDNTARYENILGNAYLWSVNTADPSQPKMFWADCKCYMWQVDQTSPNMGCSVRCVKD